MNIHTSLGTTNSESYGNVFIAMRMYETSALKHLVVCLESDKSYLNHRIAYGHESNPTDSQRTFFAIHFHIHSWIINGFDQKY